MESLTSPKISPSLFFPDHLVLLKMSLCTIESPHALWISLSLRPLFFLQFLTIRPSYNVPTMIATEHNIHVLIGCHHNLQISLSQDTS